MNSQLYNIIQSQTCNKISVNTPENLGRYNVTLYSCVSSQDRLSLTILANMTFFIFARGGYFFISFT